VLVDELAQLLQPLDLARSVMAMAARRAQGGDEAGLLEIAQHALRPAGGGTGLLDGQHVHHARTYHDCVKFVRQVRE
jgi:hypothetical protein